MLIACEQTENCAPPQTIPCAPFKLRATRRAVSLSKFGQLQQRRSCQFPASQNTGFRVKITSLSLFSALVATPLLASMAFAQSGAGAPTLTVRTEEPTGVFYDRDTLETRTPLLFTARVENPATESRVVDLQWRITDASGKTVWKQGGKLQADANGVLLRRELFDTPARGAYLLDVSAMVKVKGPDFELRQKIPFAIIPAPPLNARAVARPQSFFVLSTPGDLTPPQLDFFGRMGARVLRSPLPINPANPNWNAVETQLGERVRRNLATIALLPLGDDSSVNQAFWSRQVPENLARYGSLSTWELSGEVAPADLDSWAQVARARRSDVKLLGPLPTGLPTLPSNASVTLKALDGATFGWPTQPVTHPAALRRLWLSRAQAARNTGLSSFHLRRDVPATPGKDEAPVVAAGELTADYLSAIVAGSSSMAESLAPPRGDDDGQVAMARGAAFAMLSRTLEDAAFKEELFPAFADARRRACFSCRAAAWPSSTRRTGRAKWNCKWRAGAPSIFSAIPSRRRADGKLKFDINDQPVYVFVDASADVLSYALNRAKTSGLRSIAAQMLPLSRDAAATRTGQRGGARAFAKHRNWRAKRASVELDVPRSWKLAQNKYDVEFGRGRIEDLRVSSCSKRRRAAFRPARDGDPFRVIVRAGERTDWRFDPPVATALECCAGRAPDYRRQIGSDWRDADFG